MNIHVFCFQIFTNEFTIFFLTLLSESNLSFCVCRYIEDWILVRITLDVRMVRTQSFMMENKVSQEKTWN